VGGRSRSAAQYLSGQGFKEVYNLKGGFKAWQGLKAYGPVEWGLELISGEEGPARMLGLAYGLETGLRSFYQDMSSRAGDPELAKTFDRLAGIEERHQERLIQLQRAITGRALNREEFEAQEVSPLMEGGFTTQDLLRAHPEVLSSVTGLLETALALEAQALDLYSRFAHKVGSLETKDVLFKIAGEEKAHLALLGELLDRKV
jgi:rubrerythrin